MMTDLFGNERPERKGTAVPAIALSLFDAAAERNAMASGRPVSQERTRILQPKGEEWAPPRCPVHDSILLLEAGGSRRFSCPRCA